MPLYLWIASFHFDIRKDDKFIYLGLDVTDSDIQSWANYANLNQYLAFVVFDARSLPVSSFS